DSRSEAERSELAALAEKLVAALGDQAGRDIKHGADADKLAQRVEAQAREFGIKEGMLVQLARRYAEGNPNNFDAALTGLERALELAHQEEEKGRLPSNLSDALNAVLARVDALNGDGRFDDAQRAIEVEEAALTDTVAEANAVLMRVFDKGIATAIYRNAPKQAASYEIKKLDLEPVPDSAARFDALRKVRWEWYERGRDKGLNFDLKVAIALARKSSARATTGDERGTALNELGIALQTLGERESDPGRLEEAVAAYREALKERTRERVPLDWAMTQNDLGNALGTLGERESDPTRLEEAVSAYREALEERTRKRAPLDWAGTQNNLGLTLSALGQRESEPARLEEAVCAFREALKEYTRKSAPRSWAATQNNLGKALSILGERKSEPGRLEEAVAAYREALKVWTRGSFPLFWAVAQNNLGNALRALGEWESETERLEEAVVTYQEALEERTRKRVPLDWAATQNNLGNAFLTLGIRDSNPARLEDAMAAYREALEVWTRETMPLDWARTQENLATTLFALSGLSSREEANNNRAKALQAVDAALEVFNENDTPYDFGTATRLRQKLL
ncbi:MAG: tetratricopeptide repeat protein, partial [Pseudomonadota bacterium]